MPFGTGKLEWCGYPTMKKMKICLFVLTECTNVTDTHTETHGHRMTAKAALEARIALQKATFYSTDI